MYTPTGHLLNGVSGESVNAAAFTDNQTPSLVDQSIDNTSQFVDSDPRNPRSPFSMKAHTATSDAHQPTSQHHYTEHSNMYAAIPPMNLYPHSGPKSHLLAASAPSPYMHPTTYMPAAKMAPVPPKPKSTLKALPTVRDHTTDQLCPAGDEYIPREIDEAGEKKIMANGTLTGDVREYRCHTFRVPNRGDKLFMLATECARVLGYRDSYLLFNKNRSLYKIIANQVEKEDLVQQNIIPFSYRSRQIAIVTARSMFRQFGSRVIRDGRRVRDDYWESKARKQGFTENDMAGDKRPGAGKARADAAAAAAAAQAAVAQATHEQHLMMGHPANMGHTSMGYGQTHHFHPHTDYAQPIHMPPMGSIYDHTTLMAPMMNPDMGSDRREYNGLLKSAPRHEIAGPAFHDQSRPSHISEMQTHQQQTADYSRSITNQRNARNSYVTEMWRRPHEQPPSTLSQPQPQAIEPMPVLAPVVGASRSTQSPHIGSSGIATPSPMMMSAGPYSQTMPAQAPNPASIRDLPLPASSAPGATPAQQSYNYPPPSTGGSTMWSPAPLPPLTSQGNQQSPGSGTGIYPGNNASGDRPGWY